MPKVVKGKRAGGKTNLQTIESSEHGGTRHPRHLPTTFSAITVTSHRQQYPNATTTSTARQTHPPPPFALSPRHMPQPLFARNSCSWPEVGRCTGGCRRQLRGGAALHRPHTRRPPCSGREAGRHQRASNSAVVQQVRLAIGDVGVGLIMCAIHQP